MCAGCHVGHDSRSQFAKPATPRWRTAQPAVNCQQVDGLVVGLKLLGREPFRGFEFHALRNYQRFQLKSGLLTMWRPADSSLSPQVVSVWGGVHRAPG